MQKLDLSAPWYIYRSKLAALFELADYRRNISQLAAETARDVLTLENAAICTADLTEN